MNLNEVKIALGNSAANEITFFEFHSMLYKTPLQEVSELLGGNSNCNYFIKTRFGVRPKELKKIDPQKAAELLGESYRQPVSKTQQFKDVLLSLVPLKTKQYELGERRGKKSAKKGALPRKDFSVRPQDYLDGYEKGYTIEVLHSSQSPFDKGFKLAFLAKRLGKKELNELNFIDFSDEESESYALFCDPKFLEGFNTGIRSGNPERRRSKAKPSLLPAVNSLATIPLTNKKDYGFALPSEQESETTRTPDSDTTLSSPNANRSISLETTDLSPFGDDSGTALSSTDVNDSISLETANLSTSSNSDVTLSNPEANHGISLAMAYSLLFNDSVPMLSGSSENYAIFPETANGLWTWPAITPEVTITTSQVSLNLPLYDFNPQLAYPCQQDKSSPVFPMPNYLTDRLIAPLAPLINPPAPYSTTNKPVPIASSSLRLHTDNRPTLHRAQIAPDPNPVKKHCQFFLSPPLPRSSLEHSADAQRRTKKSKITP